MQPGFYAWYIRGAYARVCGQSAARFVSPDFSLLCAMLVARARFAWHIVTWQLERLGQTLYESGNYLLAELPWDNRLQ